MATPWTTGHALFVEWVDTFPSQEAAGEAIGTSQANVSEIYRGKRMPRMDLAGRIRDATEAPRLSEKGDWVRGAIAMDAWSVSLASEKPEPVSAATGTDGG